MQTNHLDQRFQRFNPHLQQRHYCKDREVPLGLSTKAKGIADLIRDIMRAGFLGRAQAQHRSILLGRIKIHEPGMKDRGMRRIYGKILPVGWCEDGIYVIDDIVEVEKMIETETRRRDSIEDKLEMLQRHRHFLIAREREKQAKQMRLF